MNLARKIEKFDELIQEIYDDKGCIDDDIKILLSARQVLCDLDTDIKWNYTYNFESKESTFKTYYAHYEPLILIDGE